MPKVVSLNEILKLGKDIDAANNFQINRGGEWGQIYIFHLSL